MSDDVVPATFDYSVLDQETCGFVQEKTGNIRTRLKRSAEDIIVIGQDLIEVKARLPHGLFLPWIKAEFEMSRQTADNFIHVAERFDGKLLNFSILPVSVLYALAAPSTPDSVIDGVADGTIPPKIDAIKEAKEAQRRAEQARLEAEKRAESTQQELFALQQEMESLAKPERVEVPVISPETTARLNELEGQVTTLTQQKKNLSGCIEQMIKEKREEEMEESFQKNRERRLYQTHARKLRDLFGSSQATLHHSLEAFLLEIPSDIDIAVLEADDWNRVRQTIQELEHVRDRLVELQNKRYKIVESDNTVDASVVVSESATHPNTDVPQARETAEKDATSATCSQLDTDDKEPDSPLLTEMRALYKKVQRHHTKAGSLFWYGGTSGSDKESLARKDYLDRVEAFAKSGDPVKMEAAIYAMKRTLGIRED